MSYKQIKEENGDYALVISGFGDGSNANPYDGTNMMSQVNLNTPGEVSVGYPLTTSTIASGTVGIPISRATRTTAYVTNTGNGNALEYFILDVTGQVWSSTSLAGTWSLLSSNAITTGASANDSICYFDGYLFKFRNTSIDYWTGSAWVQGWNPATGGNGASGTITGAVQHFSLVGVDDALYFCNGQSIGSIIEVEGATFLPTTPATYLFATIALQLPKYDVAQSLAEQGTNLLIGGSQNAVYPWDRLSTSFAYPIFIGDGFIRRMVTVNTNVYIFPGSLTGRGRIYISNGSQANVFFKIPDYLFGENDPYFVWGDAIWHRNNLIFGFYVKQNSGVGNINSSEVWAIDLGTNIYGSATESNFRSISSRITNSLVGSATALIPDTSNSSVPGLGYMVGMYDVPNGQGIIGYSGTTVGIGTFFVTTDLIPAGTFLYKKTYTQLEFKLRSPLQSGETIFIDYITDTGSGAVGNASFASVGGVISYSFPVTFEKCQWIQFLVRGDGNSGLSGVRLEELRLR